MIGCKAQKGQKTKEKISERTSTIQGRRRLKSEEGQGGKTTEPFLKKGEGGG